jgi:hypothetical protein
VLAEPRFVQPIYVGSCVEEAQPVSALKPDIPHLEAAGVGELADPFVGADAGVGTAGRADVEIRLRLGRGSTGAANGADD